MIITEREFDAIESAVGAAFDEDMADPDVCEPTLEKMREVYKRYRFLKDMLTAYDPAEYRREYIEEFGMWE